MKTFLTNAAHQIASLVIQAGAQFDPEVLQWPGGSVIALLLLFRTTATSAIDSLRISTYLQKVN